MIQDLTPGKISLDKFLEQHQQQLKPPCIELIRSHWLSKADSVDRKQNLFDKLLQTVSKCEHGNERLSLCIQQRQRFFARTKTSKRVEIVCFGFWCFLYAQNLFAKKKTKKNWLEIVLISSFTIPLTCTPINSPIENLSVHNYFYL